jgi:hypothetical protein
MALPNPIPLEGRGIWLLRFLLRGRYAVTHAPRAWLGVKPLSARVKYGPKRGGQADQALAPVGPSAAVLEALRRSGAPRPAVPAEQLPLLEVAPGEAEAEPAAPAGERRGGRPPGARNRRTEEWVDYLLSRYRSPLIVLAETYSRPAEVLAAELGISRAEAFAMQLTAARELAPYVHARQALAAPAVPTAAVELVLTGVEPPADGAGEGGAIDVSESEADQ